MVCNKTVKLKITGGHRTKGAKDKQKRCTRGYRRSTLTGRCEPLHDDNGPDNTLFSNNLIHELSQIPDVKRVLKSKNIMFQTRTQFVNTKMSLAVLLMLLERCNGVLLPTCRTD